MRRNLVIVRAGDNSLHPEWLKGAPSRTWDLVVNYYGDKPDIYRVPGIERIDSKGPKWPALHDLVSANPRFLEDYDYVWLPDDDLRTDAAQINLLFKIMEQQQLQVAQPALTWNSYFGHLTTIANKKFFLRYTNYVEVMAPCLSAQLLCRALPLFNFNLSGWGLDFVWTKFVAKPEIEIAIIDVVNVEHTRPVGGPNYKVLRERGISPWDELRAFCKSNGIEEEPIIFTHRAIYRDGTVIDARAKPRRFILSAIAGYLPALRHSPEAKRMARRMAGMIWKALNNMPDRIAEESLIQKQVLRR
ncbi:hypothetical protein [Acidocella aromatica]|uniref:DUF707 domain-containing protein n=1 Tax=Acidocella aromatica TaxID=1303579 RepID=A0A840VPJ1_9PROT|nr:hypothetical protein [Acidocella aromatica]MBB5374049.1 hypothetical protein [Acidocella aromatica]